MLVEVRVNSLGTDPRKDTPVVILQETGGDRVLPIWIGPCEANAIEMYMKGAECERPLTHDLLANVLGGLGGKLDRIVIDRVEELTYFAQFFIRCKGKVVQVDARPSDSIAVALRVGAPIYARDELLVLMPIEIIDDPEAARSDTTEAPPPSGMSGKELQEYLRKLDPEDFGRFSP